MLNRLRVSHYALIDEVEIEFGPGLNIITGETGAGKSILMGALGLVLGVRANADVIRTGESRCTVEATFEFSEGHPSLGFLADMGIEVDDGELILRREVNAESRSRCFANGSGIPVRSLQALGRLLVDLHGQHDHQSLLDVDRHLEFLDGYAGHGDLVSTVQKSHGNLAGLHSRLSDLEAEVARLGERRELLSFQAEEIASAALHPGEEEALVRERALLENAERLIDTASQIEQLLYQGEDSIADRVGLAEGLLADAARVDTSLETRVKELEAIGYEVEELSRFFTSYGQSIEHDPERLGVVVDRIETIQRLKAKYGDSIEEVLAYAEEAERELKRANASDGDRRSIQAEIEAATRQFAQACETLTASRQDAAGRMTDAIESSLVDLGMPDVTFEVVFVRDTRPEGASGEGCEAGAWGAERCEFYLSTNPGESVRPLVRIASGGEISRIMLALKSVLAQTDTVQVLIFDEIDIGISGRIAEVVGRRLKTLSASCQTVSITHLPQIAKMADRHFSVQKETDGGRTETFVRSLAEEDRISELAKLLGGEEISNLTVEHAREMLSKN
ncbi:MAG: DNA repair protein RecN [Gemmatimonadetes bacterium]|nr:DNA repair protein RecN [Gemmatimonadota bacterium]|tara:strand:+ start:1756 stop:3447 length:1692 start_codon:yes stop_codon:yes gene_type:complete